MAAPTMQSAVRDASSVLEQLEPVWGLEEGMALAVGQIDELLRAEAKMGG